MDEICEKLGMDPLEFRLLNGSKEGTRNVAGPRYPRIGYLETVQAARVHDHYTAPLEGPTAAGEWPPASGETAVGPPARRPA